ncbi:solute carrier organic anion transporter family member 74D [Wyeomyia smithii]|uniref:solute carrier organic anion transporter family member 74D n=1 Tax=Wyeomyia smithii TaxID=174621 RepID=UPI002467C793|nr:solute carrier organic anion transporter family member 74D [Wyeomyia smithii]XP_055550084.1 solute carrier organic anion transporter family member 74D [Wyeomyia smithii]XP_055550085.1 solute carrier organic anion transporter family member 74D [Wyeomyia smithii]XP_055550086.1 solute carrier organic anion transporter family member 74D [Wyeomyia smithii]XP_055550087.1 solute carrier organic anion transporter family member 74D [Wyeomyia smithii]XP_055550088.1 solute carrier organic anion transp
MRSSYLCGLSSWHPTWLQRFATSRTFIMVYGLLGTTQAMAYIYFVITLTTLEKRFKIPSSTTGIILSGNEISQILLSLILSYVGGHRNRPRWIAWGVVFCALSCFILASPHFIYGAGESALQLTKEFISDQEAEALLKSHNLTTIVKSTNRLCLSTFTPKECQDIISVVPLILIFMSQFVLGIGNTLYYSLGQTYLDDNTKKTNTPLMLAYASSLRTFGPVVGFALGYFTLKIYIDPSKTPIIDSSDPRWLGAWWLGWIILGAAMLIFAALIGLFPKELPKNKPVEIKRPKSNMPVVLMNDAEAFGKEKNPLSRAKEAHNNNSTTNSPEEAIAPLVEFPQLKDFPKALMRLLKNKLLMFNIISGVFYILGSSGYITFLSKYIEVQFHKSTANATVITGPITLFGMVAGFLISGIVISKKKPSPKVLLFWNVIVGVGYMCGQFSYLFLTCPDGTMPLVQGRLNLSTTCNSHCHCDGIPYSPICQEETGITFFSACHAGCDMWNTTGKYYDQCTCQNEHYSSITTPWDESTSSTASFRYTEPPTMKQFSSSTGQYVTNTISTSTAASTTTEDPDYDYSPNFKSLIPHENITNQDFKSTNDTSEDDSYSYDDSIQDYFDRFVNGDGDFNATSSEEPEQSRQRRELVNFTTDSGSSTTQREESFFNAKLIPGACLKGCAFGFYLFSIISSIINCFGASGRIGNLLVNYRCVAKEDKSFTQGLILMMISLFALIPGPIIYGRIIDSTCLVWTEECGTRGNCQLYDQRLFRYYINFTALGLTAVGVFFDVLVWWHGKTLDLYGEREAEEKKAVTKIPAKSAFS